MYTQRARVEGTTQGASPVVLQPAFQASGMEDVVALQMHDLIQLLQVLQADEASAAVVPQVLRERLNTARKGSGQLLLLLLGSGWCGGRFGPRRQHCTIDGHHNEGGNANLEEVEKKERDDGKRVAKR